MLKQLRKKCDKYKLQLTHTDTYLKYNINSTSVYILTHVAGRSESAKAWTLLASFNLRLWNQRGSFLAINMDILLLFNKVGPWNQRGSFLALNMDILLFLFNKVCPWNQRGSFLALNMYRRKICSALISEHSYLIYKLQMCHIQTKEFITMTRRAAISQQRLQLWRSLC